MIRNIPSKTEFNFKHDITLISNENVAKDVKKNDKIDNGVLKQAKMDLNGEKSGNGYCDKCFTRA